MDGRPGPLDVFFPCRSKQITRRKVELNLSRKEDERMCVSEK